MDPLNKLRPIGLRVLEWLEAQNIRHEVNVPLDDPPRVLFILTGYEGRYRIKPRIKLTMNSESKLTVTLDFNMGRSHSGEGLFNQIMLFMMSRNSVLSLFFVGAWDQTQDTLCLIYEQPDNVIDAVSIMLDEMKHILEKLITPIS